MSSNSSTQKNYEALGLKCGLEIHQQLETGKLFSRTSSELNESNNFDFVVQRKLRPSASEMGTFDKSSIEAFTRNETFFYHGTNEQISLIELDEEPPQPIDEDALSTVLEFALMTQSQILGLIVPMRKNVIDGSNTSGFQRTTLISFGGSFEIKSGKKINLETIVLEEDAARPIEKKGNEIHYNLDRLGIPLIEIATAPDITIPSEAVETAKKIGELLRITCKTKRGKGTIRQDVNVSIKGGARCEIKGCQELEKLGEVVEKEAERQSDLLELKKILNEKFKTIPAPEQFFSETKELSKIFEKSECKFLVGKKIFGFRVKNFKGLLGFKVGAKRFGSELSAYGKANGITGILHTDELPNYGITEQEKKQIEKELNCVSETDAGAVGEAVSNFGTGDAFIIAAAEKQKAESAFAAIKKRILFAFEGVPKETRGPLEDSSSEYQRPLSSEARMYPETDILPIVIDEQKINLISKELPKSVSEREEYYKKLGLSVNHIEEMKLNNFARFFEECVEEKTNPVTTATTLLQTITELKRKGISFEKKYFSELKEILKAEALGKINKKNIPEALEEIVSGKTASQIIEEQSKFANTTSDVEITGELKKIIEKNSELVLKKTMGAIGPLMGDVMKNEKLRGVDGKKISEILKKEIILFVEKHQHA